MIPLITLPADIPKTEKLIRLLPLFPTVYEAAKAAGFSRLNRRGIQSIHLVKSAKFQNQELREYYNAQHNTPTT